MLAFKEWSYIVEALGKGKQNIILRKGGISEDDFTLKSNKFLLFPTLYHQAHSFIKPEWLDKLDGNLYQQDDKVEIKYYAEVADSKVIADKNILDKLYPYHAWTKEIIEERFERWHKNIQLLIVQVYQLHKPLKIDIIPEYGGCKSWIDINAEISLEGTPVINPGLK
jgi:hypothetical protein